ncbi:hypothetical protein ACU8KH_00508 [Lachancea thermotolerans]
MPHLPWSPVALIYSDEKVLEHGVMDGQASSIFKYLFQCAEMSNPTTREIYQPCLAAALISSIGPLLPSLSSSTFIHISKRENKGRLERQKRK